MDTNENTDDFMNKKSGSIEQVSNQLIPARVTIVSIIQKTEKPDGTKFKVPILQILCKHPEKDEPISISKIKILPEDKVITKTTWVVLDSNEDIQKGSSVDDILNFLEIDCLADAVGKELDTVSESKDSHFLCLKLFN